MFPNVSLPALDQSHLVTIIKVITRPLRRMFQWVVGESFRLRITRNAGNYFYSL